MRNISFAELGRKFNCIGTTIKSILLRNNTKI